MGEKASKAVVTYAGVRVAVSVAPDGALLINVGPVKKPKDGKSLTPDADGLVPLRVVIIGSDGKPAQRLRRGLARHGRLQPSVPAHAERDAGQHVV